MKRCDTDVVVHSIPSHTCKGTDSTPGPCYTCQSPRWKGEAHGPRDSVQGKDRQEKKEEQWVSVGAGTGAWRGPWSTKEEAERKQEKLCGGSWIREDGNEDKDEPCEEVGL